MEQAGLQGERNVSAVVALETVVVFHSSLYFHVIGVDAAVVVYPASLV